jgi:hypothetical protein
VLAREIKKNRRSASKDDKIPWPVKITFCEYAICKHDEWVFKNAPGFVDDVVAATEARVIAVEKMGSLEFLCEKGCPRRPLLYFLGMCENRGVTKAVKMTGFDSEDLNKELRRIRKCVSTIEALNARRFGDFGHFVGFPEHFALCKFLLLPSMLRDYSALVKHAVHSFGGKSDFYLDFAKAVLVKFVHRCTKEFRDEKVVDLLSVMLGAKYSAIRHRNWRSKYLKRRRGYRPDPTDPPSLRITKTLLDMQAAVLYRMGGLHPGAKHLRPKRRTPKRTK